MASKVPLVRLPLWTTILQLNGLTSEFDGLDGSHSPVCLFHRLRGLADLVAGRRAVITRAPLPMTIAALATASTGYYIKEYLDRHP